MGMNDTPSGERIHIGFFGCRNAGKSSLINAVTGQELSIVSPVKGTTTDPVYKAMELLPAGPVEIIDTPGLDDEGDLGERRVAKSREVLRKCDVAVVVIDALAGLGPEDRALLAELEAQKIPTIRVYNKADLLTAPLELGDDELLVSAATGLQIDELKERIAAVARGETTAKTIAGDLVQPLDLVVLVVPIDKAAPKGRLILPQQQTIRDLLERGAVPVVTRDTELKDTLDKLAGRVALVITDSQAFRQVAAVTPETIPLTSFSILFARYKGDLETQVRGARALDALQDGDTVLVAEACTHHRQCGDIGSVKLPQLIRQKTGKQLNFEWCSGREFPQDLSRFRLVAHCGGCMINEREMQWRIKHVTAAGLPIVNYGVAIAYLQGILERSLRPFPELHALLQGEQ